MLAFKAVCEAKLVADRLQAPVQLAQDLGFVADREQMRADKMRVTQ